MAALPLLCEEPAKRDTGRYEPAERHCAPRARGDEAMFDLEMIKELKIAFAEASRKAHGMPKPYAWEAGLFDAMTEHNRVNTLESLKKVKTIVKQAQSTDSKEVEDELGMLLFLIGIEKGKIQEHEQLERITEKRMVENEFRVNSNLTLYKETFGGGFSEALGKLHEGSRWLDGGAGEANAMIEYLESGGKGRCLAVGYKVPVQAEKRVEEATHKFSGRFQYVQGKYFGEMEDMELGGRGFALISDLNGVLYYTKTLVEDMKRYLDLLDVGGVFVFTNVHIEIDMPHALEHKGYVPALARWVSNIGGVKVLFHESKGSYEVHKTSAEILIPPLELKLYQTQATQNDPIRKYSCAQQLPLEVVRV